MSFPFQNESNYIPNDWQADKEIIKEWKRNQPQWRPMSSRNSCNFDLHLRIFVHVVVDFPVFQSSDVGQLGRISGQSDWYQNLKKPQKYLLDPEAVVTTRFTLGSIALPASSRLSACSSCDNKTRSICRC